MLLINCKLRTKKQTIDGWTDESSSITIFVTKYRDLLHQMP